MDEKTAKIEELQEELNHLYRYANQCEEFGKIGQAQMLYKEAANLHKKIEALKAE